MSKRGRRFLLWMYPADIRDTYGTEVLWLIQDRWRDETGLARRLRLCADICADLVGAHLLPRHELGTAPSEVAQGSVLFSAFTRDARGLATVIPGMVLSLLMVTAFVRLITPEGDRATAMLLERFFALL